MLICGNIVLCKIRIFNEGHGSYMHYMLNWTMRILGKLRNLMINEMRGTMVIEDERSHLICKIVHFSGNLLCGIVNRRVSCLCRMTLKV